MSTRIPNEPHKAVLHTAVSTTVLIAVGAFVLSFAALTDLAERSGIDAQLAWIRPIIVDGMIVASTVAIVALNGHSRRAMIYPWALLFFGAIVSTAANSVHAILTVDTLQSGIPPVVSALVAAMPPVVLLAITHLTVHMYQKRAEAAQLHEEVAAMDQAYYSPEQAYYAPDQAYYAPEIPPEMPAYFPGAYEPTVAPAPAAWPANLAPAVVPDPAQQTQQMPAPVPAPADEGAAPLYEETFQALNPDETADGDARLREPANA